MARSPVYVRNGLKADARWLLGARCDAEAAPAIPDQVAASTDLQIVAPSHHLKLAPNCVID